MDLASDNQSPVSSPATSANLDAVLSFAKPQCSTGAQGGLKEYVPVLVSPGCRNNVAQTEWLKQQKLIVSQFWRLEV